MNKQFYENLCIKDFTNNISDQEKTLLKKWLGLSNENRLMYEEFKDVWLSTKPKDPKLNLDLEEEWENLKNNISSKTDTKTSNKQTVYDIITSSFAPRLKPVWAIGLAVLIIISSIVIVNNSGPEKVIKTISTQNGQRLEVLLSDGSMVKLNNDSEIKYDENFSDNKREINLKGEAYFSVKKDGRPFIIHTNNAVTQVLGTKFNVWSRASETRVFVKEGKVSFAENMDTTKKVYLTRNESSKIIEENAPTQPTKINANFMLGWLDGKLVFEKSSLSEITKDLERYYDVKVNIDDPEILEYSLTGSFDNENIDSVLTKICLALNINYSQSNGSYNFKK